MKILLSDGSGITSRQLATILAKKGHEVHVLCPAGLTLTKLTRWVIRAHQVPSFGPDPYRWLDAALEVLRREKFDVLICAQEQVAALSAEAQRVRDLGVKMAVPNFGALRRVMDKASAYQTLREAGLSQPDTAIVDSSEELAGCSHLLPAYVKTPIGTSSAGVRLVRTAAQLLSVATQHQVGGAFVDGGQILCQRAVEGDVLMISAVYESGRLLAWHACVKVRDGPNGGAAGKCSLPLPFIAEDLAKLGFALGWTGALSMDAILVATDGKAYYIDVNPRIVEPMNALLAGVDMVDCLLRASDLTLKQAAGHINVYAQPKPGVCSHQFFLALMKAAEMGRFEVLREVFTALTGRGEYYDSYEELTPADGDWLSTIFVALMACLLLVFGRRLAEHLSRGNASKYALSRQGWTTIMRHVDER